MNLLCLVFLIVLLSFKFLQPDCWINSLFWIIFLISGPLLTLPTVPEMEEKGHFISYCSIAILLVLKLLLILYACSCWLGTADSIIKLQLLLCILAWWDAVSEVLITENIFSSDAGTNATLLR